MNKEARDAEIDRICDIAVAAENGRLAEGGVGPGDMLDLRETINFQEGIYRAPQPIVLDKSEPPCRDEYRELIEAEPEAEPEALPVNATARVDITRKIEEIRGRVMGYDRPIREDIGFLLTLVDAWLA
jgi:hypothetical protein